MIVGRLAHTPGAVVSDCVTFYRSRLLVLRSMLACDSALSRGRTSLRSDASLYPNALTGTKLAQAGLIIG